MEKVLTFSPLPEEKGKRIDLFLSEKIKNITRSYIKTLIEKGFVTVNNLPVKPSAKVKGTETITIVLKEKKPLNAIPQNIPLDIIYEDSDLIVLNKPAGMVVHPAPGNPDNTLVNALLAYCSLLADTGSPLRPGIVHRLDKGTSGLMIVTKNDSFHQYLSDSFKKRTVVKKYLAIAFGTPARKNLTIETLYGRDPKNRKKMSGRVSRGKSAVTKVELLENLKEFSYLKVAILTGRTHQIRVHLAEANIPIIGDTLYFQKGGMGKVRDEKIINLVSSLTRPMLHSSYLEFYHPVLKKVVSFEANPPEDFKNTLEILREYGRDKGN